MKVIWFNRSSLDSGIFISNKNYNRLIIYIKREIKFIVKIT